MRKCISEYYQPPILQMFLRIIPIFKVVIKNIMLFRQHNIKGILNPYNAAGG